jgi:hypothetical protein
MGKVFSNMSQLMRALSAALSASEPRSKVLNWQSEIENRQSIGARSSVGSERTPDKREVGSSNLPGPSTLMIDY